MTHVSTSRDDLFPYSALRVLGAMQIVLGFSCLSLGVGDLVMMTLNYEELASRYAVTPAQKTRFQTLVSLTVASAPVWCGTWFIVTGALGTCVSRSRSHSLKFLKIAYLVLSVLCAAFFGPACTVLSCIISITRHTMNYEDLTWLLTAASAVLAVCEMGVAATSGAICCCCSPLKHAKVHTFYDNHPVLPEKRKRNRGSYVEGDYFYPVPDRLTRKKKRRFKQAEVQTDPPPPPPPPPPVQQPAQLPLPVASLPPYPAASLSRRRVDPRYPILRQPSLNLLGDGEEEEEEEESRYGWSPVSSRSGGYERLKKWALPQGRLY